MICEQCGENLILRNSIRGEFWGCSGYPACKNKKNIAVARFYETQIAKTDDFYKLAKLVREERLRKDGMDNKHFIEEKADFIMTMYRVYLYGNGLYLDSNVEYKLDEFINYIKQQGEDNIFGTEDADGKNRKYIKKIINKNYFKRVFDPFVSL
ncbi:MAG: topoisomerase DNA-binding C4 zinc finger domain-containing protein [Firmicutes bacterium]|nr:topoisomerase DNA-binding C4 zinc finger domain-containing protein [Bacillota bacterium]